MKGKKGLSDEERKNCQWTCSNSFLLQFRQINFIDFSSSFYPFLLFFVSSGALEESVQQIVGSDKFLYSVEFAFISRLCA